MNTAIFPNKSSLILNSSSFLVISPNHWATSQFLDLLETFGLKHYINVATDRRGHILDFVLTRSDDDPVSNFKVTKAVISGHLAVQCKIAFKKPSCKRKYISYRNNKLVVKQSFISDIKKSLLNNSENIDDVAEFTALYGNTLSSILEKYAHPLKNELFH